jgi:uncharacterized phiE125 gp8 family phage protein
MALKLTTAPTTEPVSLVEAKLHLRVDSGTFAEDLTSVQSIAPGAHVIAAAYSLLGTSIDVLGYQVIVLLESGTNLATGTVDVKLQDSDNGTIWADVTSGAFTQVTTANDNATYELAYTGIKHYLKAVATVANATCEFGVSIVKNAPTGADDSLITDLITTARQHVENVLRRSLITQTWDLWLDAFPYRDYIEIPLPPLVSITSIKYYDTANTEYLFPLAPAAASTAYYVDVISNPGRIGLAYGVQWPQMTLRSYNGVDITFVSGYGAAASVPKAIKQAMLLLIAHFYENREAVTSTGAVPQELKMAVDALLMPYRVFGF